MVKLIKDDGSKAEINNFCLTPKGISTVAAIESGLLPEVEGGWDDTAFKEFWENFTEGLIQNGYVICKICKD